MADFLLRDQSRRQWLLMDDNDHRFSCMADELVHIYRSDLLDHVTLAC